MKAACNPMRWWLQHCVERGCTLWVRGCKLISPGELTGPLGGFGWHLRWEAGAPRKLCFERIQVALVVAVVVRLLIYSFTHFYSPGGRRRHAPHLRRISRKRHRRRLHSLRQRTVLVQHDVGRLVLRELLSGRFDCGGACFSGQHVALRPRHRPAVSADRPATDRQHRISQLEPRRRAHSTVHPGRHQNRAMCARSDVEPPYNPCVCASAILYL